MVGPTDSGSFTIEAPSPRPTPPTRSVVVGPDGTVDLDADPWPQGEDPC
ncbi:MAG TPA: hypothetical protein VFK38_01970 [Candidatus Limnocylindrales bacterium]|nr:hypothetical protein [Candidatus Limnocylindrales bacterium]